jgi:hypothetical protein
MREKVFQQPVSVPKDLLFVQFPCMAGGLAGHLVLAYSAAWDLCKITQIRVTSP